MSKPDQLYGEAAIEAVGRNMAIFFMAMIANGMERAEALEIVKEWVRTIAVSKPDETKDVA